MLRRGIRRFGKGLLSVLNRLRVDGLGRFLNWVYAPLVLVLVLATVPPLLVGSIFTSNSISTSGVIMVVDISFYGDENCTVPLAPIEWGVLSPGASIDRTIYIKNVGSYPLTLSLSTENWSPLKAAEYIGLVWDYDGEVLDSGESIGVVLTLMVSQDITGIEGFYFDIVITGTG